jgi:Myosin-like coiled-coil protein
MAKFEAQKKAAEQEAARSRALSTQVSTFSQTESELRNQLNIYVEKFKQVRDEFHAANLQALSVEAESLAAVLALLDLRHESDSARVEEYIQGLSTCTCGSCPFHGWHGFSMATAGRPPSEEDRLCDTETEHNIALDRVSEGSPLGPPRFMQSRMTEQREVVKELKMLGKARLVEKTETDLEPGTEAELLDDRLFTFLSDGPDFTINPVTTLPSPSSIETPHPVVDLVAEAVADSLPPPTLIRMNPRPPAYTNPDCHCGEAMEDKTENFFRRFKKPDWFTSVFSGVSK